jgi:hypothetical protein
MIWIANLTFLSECEFVFEDLNVIKRPSKHIKMTLLLQQSCCRKELMFFFVFRVDTSGDEHIAFGELVVFLKSAVSFQYSFILYQ